MIIISDLVNIGWTENEIQVGIERTIGFYVLSKDNLTIDINNGVITYIRENDEYYGLTLSINNIEDFKKFLAFLPN